MQNFKIFTAVAENATALSSISQNCLGNEGWSEKSFLDSIALDYEKTICVADESDEIAAFAVVSVLGGDSLNIDSIAVLDKYRKQGLGSMLVEYIMKNAPETVDTFFLELRESNLSAMNLYKKFGFKQDGLRKNFYRNPTENAVLMSRKK